MDLLLEFVDFDVNVAQKFSQVDFCFGVFL